MPWQKAADGQLIPLDDTHIGPQAVAITELSPLYLNITLDSVSVLDSGTKYVIGMQREAAPQQKDRSKKQTYSSVGAKNDTFTLREVQGPADSPTNIVLELKDGSQALLSKEAPFKRVDGYIAEPEVRSREEDLARSARRRTSFFERRRLQYRCHQHQRSCIVRQDEPEEMDHHVQSLARHLNNVSD